jgi:hypothetical protein
MTAMKLKLPPGFYRNGTPYQSAGRWMSGDLVRWHNANIQPIYGWQIKEDFATKTPLAPLWLTSGEAARSMIAVGDTIGGVNTYIGTNKKIYRLSNSNVVTDVTPVGFSAKLKDATAGTGYGMFRYSHRSYGNKRPAVSDPVPMVFSWAFASWGTWPVAAARGDDALKVMIKRDIDAKFVPIATSPTGVNDVLVTDQRFMMTFGTPTDGKMIQWSDQENFDDWTPAIDNQAGFLRVAGTGRLVRGVRVLNQILVVGDNDAFSGQFVGPPYVYGFTRVGDKCGIIGPNAIVVTDTFAVWFGSRSFWIFDGVVRQLDCEVLDYVLNDSNLEQRSKTSAFTVSDFSECWWLYQSKDSVTNDVDSYVVYNYAQQIWYTGRIARTTGMDNDPARNVTMVALDGKVYDHEIANALYDGAIPIIRSGPLEMEDGERCWGISYVYPDDHLVGSVKMQLQVRDVSNTLGSAGTDLKYARDFDLKMPTSTHGIMGRDIRMVLTSSGETPQWVVGDFRVLPIKAPGPMR